MAINVKLIGTDEDVIGATALLTTLATTPGYVYLDTTAYKINRQPTSDISKEDYLGNIIGSTKIMRYEMEIEFHKRQYSQEMTATTDDTFYPEIKILKKPYLWLMSDNYKVGFASGYAIKVALDSLSITRKGRYILLSIKLMDSYAV